MSRYPDSGGLSMAGRAKREAVRMQAAAEMFAAGDKPAEVAQALRVSVTSAHNRHNAWREGGTDALASKDHSGSQCRLDEDQLRQLAEELGRGALRHGLDDDGWTLARVAAVIERRFGYAYSLRGVSLLLHRMGFSPQVPARRPVRRDEAAVTTWRQRRWPAVKG